jgi:Rieske Fe-S protein
MDENKSCKHCGDCNPETTDDQWKKDFPVEWEGDHYVARREMVKFLTLGSGLLAAANWAGAGIWHWHHEGSFEARHIGSAIALQREGSMLFLYPTDNDPCIAVSMPDGQIVAYSQVCTHLSCAVVYKPKEHDLFCPCHNGAFELQAGRPTAGPPTRPLPRIVIERRGDELFATGVEVSA